MAQINKPTDYFNTVLYSGDDTTTRNITGFGFQPDFVWNKARSSAYNHYLIDAVRGSPGKVLISNSTNAEDNDSGFQNSFKGFVADGNTIGQQSGYEVNDSGVNYVQWGWKANDAGSANTEGSINSIATSANATSGFSIVKYTGNGSTNQTIGHGLGTVPDFVIVKQTNTTRNWPTYSRAMGNGVTFLDITDAFASGYTNYFYPAGMTTTTFGISDNGNINESGGTYIAYVFSSRTGYSKFGKYTGNGNADGTFVYTGFKPAFIIFKQTNTSGGQWYIYDNKRGQNELDEHLYPNLSSAEATGDNAIDILSNGFKMRSSNGDSNASGGSYIYMAFAEAPLVGSNNVPCTAR